MYDSEPIIVIEPSYFSCLNEAAAWPPAWPQPIITIPAITNLILIGESANLTCRGKLEELDGRGN